MVEKKFIKIKTVEEKLKLAYSIFDAFQAKKLYPDDALDVLIIALSRFVSASPKDISFNVLTILKDTMDIDRKNTQIIRENAFHRR